MHKLLNLGLFLFFLMFPIQINAQTHVHFLNEAEEFFVDPENLDLFSEFKNLVPGGEYQQKISLSNQDDENIQLFFRRYDVDKKYEDSLSYMYLDVYLDDRLVFGSQANSVKELKERTLIAELEANKSYEMTVNLKIDPKMGNQFQESLSILEWEFYVEKAGRSHGKKTKPPVAKIVRPLKKLPKISNEILPSTGMSSQYMTAISLVILGAGLYLKNYQNKD